MLAVQETQLARGRFNNNLSELSSKQSKKWFMISGCAKAINLPSLRFWECH